MKKYLKIMIILTFLFVGKVYAISVFEGNYLSNAFIKKELNGVKYYLQVQFVKDENNKIIYCLEPFNELDSSVNYQVDDLASYTRLSNEQMDKIKLIIYYGYGSPNRDDEVWYAVTQLLIWQIVSPNTPIYFTDTLNGLKTDRYDNLINELNNDVSKHYDAPSFVKDYTINYGDNIEFNDSNYIYSSNDYEINNGLINNITHDGIIKVTKKLNYNNLNDFRLYVNPNSQTLIVPGKIDEPSYIVNIKVLKGKLNIELDKDGESLESDYNVCYELYKDDIEYKKICSNEPKRYEFDVPYGTYKMIQLKEGIGYEKITEEFKVTIDSFEEKEIMLMSHLIWNTFYLTKYYCDNDCVLEDNAIFNILDINNDIVDKMVMDKNGSFEKKLPYGHYKLEQVKGKDGYSLVKTFEFNVLNSHDELKKVLYDNVELIPPDTGIKQEQSINFVSIIASILIILSRIRR